MSKELDKFVDISLGGAEIVFMTMTLIIASPFLVIGFLANSIYKLITGKWFDL